MRAKIEQLSPKQRSSEHLTGGLSDRRLAVDVNEYRLLIPNVRLFV